MDEDNNAEAAVSFNKMCLDEGILPKYTYINTYMYIYIPNI